MPLHQMMPGAYSFFGFLYVGMCAQMYVFLYECVYIHTYIYTYVHTYVRDPVRLRLRHLYEVEFCSFIVRYPTAGASVYCGHISSYFFCFFTFFPAGLSGSVGCAVRPETSRWRVQPRPRSQHSFMEIDREIFSTVILSLPLIQEGQLSVSGERMCTILVNCLED